MRLEGKHWWKLLGLAGIMGVAATGALAARADRQRKAYTPDEVRSQLHERYAQAYAKRSQQQELDLVPVAPTLRDRMRNLLRRNR